MGSSRDKITCDVLLPCLDEAEALPWILGRMPPGFQPIVIDNGSRDGSPQLAADLGAIVLHAARRGYGSACHAGLVAATAPLVAVMDADASLDPAQLPDLIAPLARDHADLVVGSGDSRTGGHSRGRSASPTPNSPAESAGEPVSHCAISARCAPPAEKHFSHWMCRIDGRDIRSKPSYAQPMPAGALLRSTPTISSARVARR